MLPTEKNFKIAGLPATVLQALEKIGFKQPTPIQEKTIPVILSGKDVIGSAQTGTGKTGAFCIPTLARLLANPEQTALVLVPTRELAVQIDEFWTGLTFFSKQMKAAILIGGVSMDPQFRAIKKKPRLIIATPGRLCDHLKRKSIQLNNVGVLILDEADRMLDMGFAPQLNEILRYLPKQRQTLFFTATWDHSTDELAKKFLSGKPERIAVGETSKAAATVSQTLYSCTQDGKRDILVDELNTKTGSILVFVRTQHRADRVSRYLDSSGIHANRIHGGRSQGQRTTALREFREGAVRVLVATDIAARGIDVADIGHVINFDLPQVPEDYIHRIGRTGRAGATGTATSFVTSEDQDLWKDIAKLLKKTGSPVPTAKVVKPTKSTKTPDSAKAQPPHKTSRAHAQTRAHSNAPKASPAKVATSPAKSHSNTNNSGKSPLFIVR